MPKFHKSKPKLITIEELIDTIKVIRTPNNKTNLMEYIGKCTFNGKDYYAEHDFPLKTVLENKEDIEYFDTFAQDQIHTSIIKKINRSK